MRKEKQSGTQPVRGGDGRERLGAAAEPPEPVSELEEAAAEKVECEAENMRGCENLNKLFRYFFLDRGHGEGKEGDGRAG